MPRLTEQQWVEIEALYRAGVVPVRQIARDYGIDHKAIFRKAEKRGWIPNEIKEEVRQAIVEKRAKKAEESKKKAVGTGEGVPGDKKVPALVPKEEAISIAVASVEDRLKAVDVLLDRGIENNLALSNTLRDLRSKAEDPERAAQAAVLLATDGYLMGVKVLMDSAEKLQRMTLAQINFGEARKDKADGEKVLDLKAVPMSELLLMEKTLGTVLKG